jgi:hypothetical protein
MKTRFHLRRTALLGLLACASFAGHADSLTVPIDLSLGNAFFGRSTAIGSFVDTYSFTLTGSSYFVTASASSASSGAQDLDFTSLVIQDATSTVVATFAGNLGNDAIEFYALSQTVLAAGAYSLVVTGVNSPTQASYSGNIAVTPVPEPSVSAMLLAGLAGVGFMVRRRQRE